MSKAELKPVHFLKLSADGKSSKGEALPDFLQNVEVNDHLLYQYEIAFQANRRLGTVKAKDRSEVSGGGKKPWKQKGTGRARVGSNRSPLWRGGGVTHGPEPRDFGYDLPAKLKVKALLTSLKKKAVDGQLYLSDEKFEVASGKTKDCNSKIVACAFKKPLFVNVDVDAMTLRSQKNLKRIAVRQAIDVNAHDVLNSNECILSKDSIEKISSRVKG